VESSNAPKTTDDSCGREEDDAYDQGICDAMTGREGLNEHKGRLFTGCYIGRSQISRVIPELIHIRGDHFGVNDLHVVQYSGDK
jgi:hypothetical protein